MFNFFYSKILKYIDNTFKYIILNNAEYKLSFDNIINSKFNLIKNFEENKEFKKISNGAKFIVCIDETNKYNNLIIFYKDSHFTFYFYENKILQHFRINKTNFQEYLKLLNNKYDIFYQIYYIKYNTNEIIYNHKISNIINEYKIRLIKDYSKVFNYILDNTKEKIENEIVRLIQSKVIFNKASLFITERNNGNYLTELTEDLNKLEAHYKDNFLKTIKINDILKNIVVSIKGENFTKNKKLYYKELEDNKEFYYRKIIKSVYYDYLSEHIKYLKHKKLRVELQKNPMLWNKIKKEITDNNIYKEFEYLENANQFDIL